ncbi:MAG TPA: lipoyl(octanoyl) transferase LipB [Gemmataceae bacterium]|jgi:lipoyl(octanoyl) transferase|nr:lipoyl(octanoyl) transferase LipB [Gemmataceae bacterium]
MHLEPPRSLESTAADLALQVYLLGTVEFEAALALQRRLVYQVSGDRNSAALILCEHPPLISVGRQGSRTHILCSPEELCARRWPVRWVNRGGGCWLHGPGQLAIYPILALDRRGMSLQTYLERLQKTMIAALGEFTVEAKTRPGHCEVWVGTRPIAGIGVAVLDWVSYFGAALNLSPDLEPFRRVRGAGEKAGPMTSLERERRGPVRPTLVRERLVEHFAAHFDFSRLALFFDHPSLCRKAPADAVAASS